jgi:P4 family phage/plasmid primase-like protien
MASKPKRKSNHARFDLSYVRDCANGRWSEILATVAGIPADFLRSETIKSACPKCGGKDRFRFTNLDGGGSILCNQCGRDIGDGFSAIQWFTGKKFAEVLADVAAYLGIEPEAGKATTKGADPESAKDPTEHLKFEEWSDLAAEYFCLFKQGVTPQSLLAVGAKLATYRKQFPVFAIPVWGANLDAAAPVGWTIYHAAGGTLPKFTRGENGEIVTDQVKVKLTAGSKAGISGDLERLRKSTTVWKVEGYSDLLTLLSVEGFPADHAAVTNANGCGERPKPWMVTLLSDKKCFVIHDNDVPGQSGAIDKWCPGLGAANIVLPGEIAPKHGKDLRDWINAGGTWEQLQAFAAAATAQPQQSVVEADDDPHRLARINLEGYGRNADGGTLRYWRDEWYTWKADRGCYRKIGESELAAKVSASIKHEFDRLNLIAQAESDDDKPPKSLKITQALVRNVIAATASMVVLPSSIEPMTWLENRQAKNWLAMENGIFDVDAFLADAPLADIMRLQSSQWFSLVRVPYSFDPHAKCPKWEAFLEHNLEMDPQRIKVLQEWAGYLLLPDTSYGKFLALEGEGRNGKSVYLAGVRAMLGTANCSHVTLGEMAGDFAKSQMFGKLANIDSDVEDVDKIAEGTIKKLATGDVLHANRKFLSAMEFVPSARLMLSWNHRPRVADRSEGLWRRMLLIPWYVRIAEKDTVLGMDKSEFWRANGELPGIFIWALKGLARLRAQRGFTVSELSNAAINEFRNESNPARAFLLEHVEAAGTGRIRTSFLYGLYVRWCESSGYRPLSEQQFGREVGRVFPQSKKTRPRNSKLRHYVYENIEFATDEIAGEKTNDGNLF